MAEITRQRQGEYTQEIFKLLWDEEDGVQSKDVLAHVANSLELTEYEKGYYVSSPDRPRYEKSVRFASIPLSKAGWLIKSRGRWYITDEGKEAFKKYSDPEKLFKQAASLYHEWKRNRPTVDDDLNIEEDDAQITSLAYEEAEEKAWDQVKSYLTNIGGYEFQDIFAALLEAMEYHVSWIAPQGKDKGIDIIAYNDPLGTSTPRIKVQVKHRIDTRTNVEGLRAFLSTLGNEDVGIFISSGGFTKDARDEARTQESRKITLIDLETFFELWVEHYEKLSQEAKRSLPLKPIYFLAPED